MPHGSYAGCRRRRRQHARQPGLSLRRSSSLQLLSIRHFQTLRFRQLESVSEAGNVPAVCRTCPRRSRPPGRSLAPVSGLMRLRGTVGNARRGRAAGPLYSWAASGEAAGPLPPMPPAVLLARRTLMSLHAPTAPSIQAYVSFKVMKAANLLLAWAALVALLPGAHGLGFPGPARTLWLPARVVPNIDM